MRFPILLFVALLLLSPAVFAQDNTQILLPYSDGEIAKVEDQLRAENYTGAMEILDRILKRNEENVAALTYMGYAHWQLNNVVESEKLLLIALKQDPKHLGAHLTLGLMYMGDGNYNKANEHLQMIRVICEESCTEYDILQRTLRQNPDPNNIQF